MPLQQPCSATLTDQLTQEYIAAANIDHMHKVPAFELETVIEPTDSVQSAASQVCGGVGMYDVCMILLQACDCCQSQACMVP